MKLTAYFFSVFIVSLNFVSSISTTTLTEAPVAAAPRVAHFPTHDPTLAPGLLGNITDYTEELNDKIQYYFGLTQMYMDQGTSYIAYISIASAVASIFFPFLGDFGDKVKDWVDEQQHYFDSFKEKVEHDANSAISGVQMLDHDF